MHGLWARLLSSPGRGGNAPASRNPPRVKLERRRPFGHETDQGPPCTCYRAALGFFAAAPRQRRTGRPGRPSQEVAMTYEKW